jgi:hypothetical protein
MSEEKSIWKKNVAKSSWIFALLLALVGGTVIAVIAGFSGMFRNEVGGFFGAWVALVVFIWVLVVFIRWLCCWRNVKKVFFGAACLATLVALFYAEENWRGKRAWEKFKREWEAKGERFEFKDFIPAPVPDGENFAMADVVASSYEYILTRDGKKVPYEKRNTNAINRLDFGLANNDLERATEKVVWTIGATTDLKSKLAAFETKTNLYDPSLADAQNLLRAMEEYTPTIEEVRLAGQRPKNRFPLNYDTDCPAAILLPHLAALKRVGQVLQLRALAELQNKASDKALADVQLSTRLMQAMRAEPFAITHLVRASMLKRALQPVYEGLAHQQWSDNQLVKLDLELAKLDFLADCKWIMRGEVGMQSGVFDFLKQQPKELANFSSDGNNNESAGISRFVPAGWFYQNQLRCARFVMLNDLPAVNTDQQTISPTINQRAMQAWGKEMAHSTPYNFIERILLPNFNFIKFAHAQSSVDLTRTAIALERYRLAHGNFPESLDALAPQFIANVPHDVIGGGPLKYRREADGTFTLYSIGWNEKDDGGVVVLTKGSSPDVDVKQGDWVWRYPKK